MGRNKIDIKKLEPASQRRDTFKNKRSKGIKKKAKELSIISDAQVLLLMRDPKGQYHLCHGNNSTFDGVVQRFLSESQVNLNNSRRSGMKFLKNSYEKDSHAINAISIMDHGMKPINNKRGSQVMDPEHIKQEICKLESQLGPLRNINEIDAIERFDELTAMECSIMELLTKNEQEMIQIVEPQKSGCSDHSMINPYHRDNLQGFTNTSVPATNYGDNYQMDQQHVTMFNPSPFSYQRDSMASTSTALPLLPFPSMGGMEQLARVESIPTAMYNRDELREDSSFQISESDRKMLCEWSRRQVMQEHPIKTINYF